jgi:formylglycine-generating enzyme
MNTRSACNNGLDKTSGNLSFVEINPQGYEEYRNENDGSTLIRVPSVEFLMGSLPEDGFEDESPQHSVRLGEYYIGKYPVTTSQFSQFVHETSYITDQWLEYSRKDLVNHPALYVTWDEAIAYAKWAGLRLLTEAEWEHASRGTDGRNYPWGNIWDVNRCNNENCMKPEVLAHMAVLGDKRGTTPVGLFTEGVSPVGCHEMAGNVCEWCSSEYRNYPYRSDDGRENLTGHSRKRVVRGGCWFFGDPRLFRCAERLEGDDADIGDAVTGFRIAFSVSGHKL